MTASLWGLGRQFPPFRLRHVRWPRAHNLLARNLNRRSRIIVQIAKGPFPRATSGPKSAKVRSDLFRNMWQPYGAGFRNQHTYCASATFSTRSVFATPTGQLDSWTALRFV